MEYDLRSMEYTGCKFIQLVTWARDYFMVINTKHFGVRVHTELLFLTLFCVRDSFVAKVVKGEPQVFWSFGFGLFP